MIEVCPTADFFGARARPRKRAVYGSHDLAGEEFTRARLRILDAMAEQTASEGPLRVRVNNERVPARPHNARRLGAKAIPACAFVALIVATSLFSNVWLHEKWPAPDLHAALDPLQTPQPDASLTALQYAAEGDAAMAEQTLGRVYADGGGVVRDRKSVV